MNSSAFTNDSGIDDSQLYLQPQEYVGWKRIQQNTFTRWVNEHLRNVQMRVDNLETDLTDGLILIKLVEILSKKKLPRHNAKPTFRSQKLENVSVALTFLSNVEGIKLVNIAPFRATIRNEYLSGGFLASFKPILTCIGLMDDTTVEGRTLTRFCVNDILPFNSCWGRDASRSSQSEFNVTE
ncbi:hypothetical protein D918_08531 [Trichuris suis]|nr:hypothetical protein D918_08531 [Trichuris suis]